MPAILILPPAAEPLSLAEAKAWLRISHDDEDALVQSLLSSARIQAETQTRRALMTQRWRIVLDRWPVSGKISAPVTPLRALVAARVRNMAGEAETLDTDLFMLNAASAPGEIVFDAGRVVHPGQLAAGIEIDIEAGYGAAADVPADFKQAIRLLLTRAYENRDASGDDGLPPAVSALLAPHRVVSL
ncbi:MAG: head-tail connector protein [Xanthobacteraceae bacterium]|nr:head-tail connector protein [Xanthobacteraceae bacterium]QYK45806.1 MAG: head-tail connector protein [Xanthobacteraceae bacterium]